MFLLSFVIVYLLSAGSIRAQVPLYYQLIESYQPSFDTYIPPSLTIPTLPATITPTPPPQSLGKTITIAVLGDSMIDTLQIGLPQLKISLRQYFPGRNFQILNYGVGSRDIEYGLYRLTNSYDYREQHFQSLVSQNPDIIVVESFAYNNFGNTQVGLDRHRLNLEAITSTIKTLLPNTKIIIATTIAPNSVIFGNNLSDSHFTALEKIEKSSTIKLYLQNTVNFAASQGFPLADAFHLSLFANEGLKEFINSIDGLHPSTAGGQFFCDTLADTIFKNHLVN